MHNYVVSFLKIQLGHSVKKAAYKQRHTVSNFIQEIPKMVWIDKSAHLNVLPLP